MILIDMYSLADEQLAGIKHRCYRGIARVPLDLLNFQHEVANGTHPYY
jgi:hypothetical protein